MTRPSFQFYPKDWLGNTKLRRCSAAARGVWMDVLCVLHDSDEYGIARYPLAELANAAGAPLKLLRELADKGVLKGCDKGACDGYVYLPRSGRKVGAPVTLVQPQAGPIWFSSRSRSRRGSAPMSMFSLPSRAALSLREDRTLPRLMPGTDRKSVV